MTVTIRSIYGTNTVTCPPAQANALITAFSKALAMGSLGPAIHMTVSD